MFSGWGTKLKSTFGLDDKNTPPEPAVVEKPRDKLTFVPNEPLTEAPAEPDFADPAPDDTEAVPIPGAVLIDHIEQRQQLLAVRRRQIVSMATKADQTMDQGALECRQHLDFVSVVDQELKQLPHISATVMGIRTSLEKLLSDCHELELAFSEVSEAKVLLGLERWRDEQWDMMARFREAKKQEIKALERKVQAKKDKVKQVKEQQQKQAVKQDPKQDSKRENVSDRVEDPTSPLPAAVTACLEEGAHQAAAVILDKEMTAQIENLEEKDVSPQGLGEQLTDFAEKQAGAPNRESQTPPEAEPSDSSTKKKSKKKKGRA